MRTHYLPVHWTMIELLRHRDRFCLVCQSCSIIHSVLSKIGNFLKNILSQTIQSKFEFLKIACMYIKYLNIYLSIYPTTCTYTQVHKTLSLTHITNIHARTQHTSTHNIHAHTHTHNKHTRTHTAYMHTHTHTHTTNIHAHSHLSTKIGVERNKKNYLTTHSTHFYGYTASDIW